MIRSHDAQASASVPLSGVRKRRPESELLPAGTAPSLERGCVEIPGTSRLATEDAGPASPDQGLPSELLEAVLGYLPLPDQSRCALVCRRWYSHLPETRWELALHMKALSAGQSRVTGYLADGYPSRSRPFLEQGRSPLLPVLDRQNAAHLRLLQQRQEGAAAASALQESPQSASRLLSELVNYGLHQVSQACSLRLQPAVVKGSASFQSTASFSLCSRWMANRSWQPEAGNWCGQPCLYGWSEGCWHRQILESPAQPLSPVVFHTFSWSRPDCLLTGHQRGQVIRWHRGTANGSWQATSLLELGLRCSILSVTENFRGDLIVFYDAGEFNRKPLRIVSGTTDGQHRAPVAEAVYDLGCRHYFNAQRTRLAVVTPPFRFGDRCGAVDIWQRDLNAAQPAAWGCQRTPLPPGQAVEHLFYSPDDRHLLGLLAGERACLWALDAGCRLYPCLDVPCSLSRVGRDPGVCCPFSNNGQQLVLARSGHQIQFWHLQENGGWRAGERLDNRAAPAQGGSDKIRYLQLSGDGRTLACATSTRVTLWHKCDTGWRQVLERCATDTVSFLPQVWRFPLVLYASTVGLRDGWDTVCFHGLDSQGLVVEKCRFAVRETVGLVQVSPDGLTVLVYYTSLTPPVLLKLEARPADGMEPDSEQPQAVAQP